MEVFILVPLVLISLLIFILFFLKKNNSNKVKLPPGTSGLPLFGETISFTLSSSEKFIENRMKKYSENVFQTSLLGEKMAVFCGAEGNKFVFTNDNKLVTRWLPKSIAKALLFSSQIHDHRNSSNSTRKVSALRRGFQYDGLKYEALKQYIPVMDRTAREHVEKYWLTNEIKVYPLVKMYTFSLACYIFLSIQDEVQVRKLLNPFDLFSKGLLSLPIDLPGFAYNGAIKAGKSLREELMKVIRERKQEVMENKEANGKQDRLTQMLLFTDEDGQFMNEMEIANNIIGLLLPSYDSTSNGVTFVLKHLAELPHIYDEVFKEMMGIAKKKGPDELLNWEDVDNMKYSWNVARESFRVTPPNQGTFRESLADFTYAGFTIPKGWKIFWSANTTHKNPKYFPDPEKFDPTRFEGRGPAPYTYVPFGGGPRMCPGREYAKLETLVFMYNVVKRFQLERAMPNEKKVVYHSSLIPVNGLPIRLQPHGN